MLRFVSFEAKHPHEKYLRKSYMVSNQLFYKRIYINISYEIIYRKLVTCNSTQA